jgi:hypothetical protein
VIGNDLKRADLLIKRLDIFSGAVNGNRELKKRFTQPILPNVIINAGDIGSKSIMLDFKTLCSKGITYIHLNGKSGKLWKNDKNGFPNATD